MILIKSPSLLDRSAIVTLTTYTGCLLLRFLNWIQYLRTGRNPEEIENTIEYTVDLVASIFIWSVLYFFIFEMRIVRDKLSSNTCRAYLRTRKTTVRTRLILIVALTLIFLAIFAVTLV